jgi:hypothetical protein
MSYLELERSLAIVAREDLTRSLLEKSADLPELLKSGLERQRDFWELLVHVVECLSRGMGLPIHGRRAKGTCDYMLDSYLRVPFDIDLKGIAKRRLASRPGQSSRVACGPGMTLVAIPSSAGFAVAGWRVRRQLRVRGAAHFCHSLTRLPSSSKKTHPPGR